MRRSIVALFALSSLSTHALLAVAALTATGCSGAPEGPLPLKSGAGPATSAEDGQRPDGGVQGTPSAPPAPPAPPPKAEEITEAYGVFVSKTGAADAPGTRAAPLASIAEAIELAKAAKPMKRVFVCEGIYEEALELASGVSIVGGLDCSGAAWKLTTKKSTLLAPTSPAIHAVNIVSPTRIDNLDVVAPDAAAEPTTAEARSSIGALVVDSNALTFANGSIHAGVAAKGIDGIEAEPLRLEVLRYAALGRPVERACADPTIPNCGTSRPGGQGSQVRCISAAGVPLSSSTGDTGGASGVFTRNSAFASWAVYNVQYPGQGSGGSGAVNRANGISGASSTGGVFSEAGFLPGDGAAGTSGTAGSPGKGGSGTAPVNSNEIGTFYGKSGSGGGAGGCAGLAGTAGTGGGASLGVVALRSPLRFDAMEIAAAAGGAGGKGTFGSAPTPGTPGGDVHAPNTVQLPTSTDSFDGTPGGESGMSGNGAGGPSYAVAHQGGAPILTQTNTKSGAGGAGVAARSQGGKTLAASPGGESAGVKSL